MEQAFWYQYLIFFVMLAIFVAAMMIVVYYSNKKFREWAEGQWPAVTEYQKQLDNMINEFKKWLDAQKK